MSEAPARCWNGPLAVHGAAQLLAYNGASTCTPPAATPVGTCAGGRADTDATAFTVGAGQLALQQAVAGAWQASNPKPWTQLRGPGKQHTHASRHATDNLRVNHSHHGGSTSQNGLAAAHLLCCCTAHMNCSHGKAGTMDWEYAGSKVLVIFTMCSPPRNCCDNALPPLNVSIFCS